MKNLITTPLAVLVVLTLFAGGSCGAAEPPLRAPLSQLAVHGPIEPGGSRCATRYTEMDGTKEAFLLILSLPSATWSQDTETRREYPELQLDIVSDDEGGLLWSGRSGEDYWDQWHIVVPKTMLKVGGKYRLEVKGVDSEGALHRLQDGVFFVMVKTPDRKAVAASHPCGG